MKEAVGDIKIHNTDVITIPETQVDSHGLTVILLPSPTSYLEYTSNRLWVGVNDVCKCEYGKK